LFGTDVLILVQSWLVGTVVVIWFEFEILQMGMNDEAMSDVTWCLCFCI